MNAIIDAALSKTRTVILTLLVLLLGGYYSYLAIPKESEPDINIPIIYVSLDLRGISPEDAERLLIRPMETKLRAVEGLKEMRSTGYLGGGSIILEFEAGFDADKALTDVREKVDEGKPDLPSEAEEPSVNEVNLSLFPIITVILSGNVPERALLKIARDLKDEIEGIESVLEADIGGDRKEQVEVIIDPLLGESFNAASSNILQKIDQFNSLVAAGSIETGRGGFNVKVPGLFETVQDVMNMPFQVSGDAVVTLGDVADIRQAYEDPKAFARLGGERAIALEVKKRTGENIIETIEKVQALVNFYKENLPKTVHVTFYGDQSDKIKIMLSDLQNNVISAILLVMIVIVGALGLRAAGLVGIAIPGSFLTGILVLYMMNLSMNVVVLFSLILAVGMLVDGAIVLAEYAETKLHEGYKPMEAYGMAAKRMAWPITASTATTLAAFLPLLFWPGVVGEFMKFMPITLMATLTASLLMALIFVPVLGAVFSKIDHHTHKSKESANRLIENISSYYTKLLIWALHRPWKVIVSAVVSLFFVYFIYGIYGKGVEFFPDVEPDFAKIQVHARGNLSIYEKDQLVKEVEKIVLEVKEEKSEITAVYSRSGEQGQNEEAEDIIGSIQIEFGPWQERRDSSAILADILNRSEKLAGIFVEARKKEAGPPVGKPVQIEVASSNPNSLRGAVTKILHEMEQQGGYLNIEDGFDTPGIEWELIVDRSQAVKFGADIAYVGAMVQLVTNGYKISSYRPDDSDDEIDIVVRYPEEYRTISQLDSIRLSTENGLVPISNFVERNAQPKVGTVHRTDGWRTMTIKADVEEGILADDKVREMEKWLQTADLPPEIKITFKGEDQEQKEAGEFLFKALLIALFSIAIILVTQFNSFYRAFLILSAVIMSTLGVFIGLLITGQPFGIVMSGVGVIALAGIVVNNNIVLIDTFDKEAERLKDAYKAIIATGQQRLRPVLLTTVTTILGLLPMVLQLNIDFISREISYGAPSTQWWVQLATGIVSGLTFATLLTLVMTPCLLYVRYKNKYK